jgi:hypothetical protein
VQHKHLPLMRLDDNASTEHFIFTEVNNLLNNIISNTASTQNAGTLHAIIDKTLK